MDCDVRSNPRAYKIEWFHDVSDFLKLIKNSVLQPQFSQGLRVQTTPEDGLRILAGGKSLVIQSIVRKYSGNYTCVGYNLEGEDVSNAIKLDVLCKHWFCDFWPNFGRKSCWISLKKKSLTFFGLQWPFWALKYLFFPLSSVIDKPECVKSETVTLGVVPKRDAEIMCRVHSLPAATHFRWTFNNSLGSNDVPVSKVIRHSKRADNGTHVSTLQYRAESDKDFGVVQCFASNSLGESPKPCIFAIIPAGIWFAPFPVLVWTTYVSPQVPLSHRRTVTFTITPSRAWLSLVARLGSVEATRTRSNGFTLKPGTGRRETCSRIWPEDYLISPSSMKLFLNKVNGSLTPSSSVFQGNQGKQGFEFKDLLLKQLWAKYRFCQTGNNSI